MAAYVQHKMRDQEAAGRNLKWPGHNTDCKIAAHRIGSESSSAHHRNQSNQQKLDVPKLAMSTPVRASSGKGRAGMAADYPAHGTRRQSPKRRNNGWEEQQSLLNILSQPSPHRQWSAEGFTGRPELDTTVTQSQMLPGTISWTSPRNHIGVHPESLLYHRDPEQLAADVIGLTEKYATLANEHKLQKVQINKLSSSLSRERAEAAELSEVAEMMGMASPRSRALSPPGSPGRAFRSPCRPQSRPTSARLAREQSGASVPEWVFTDLQQRLNAAQQLLDKRSMACNQGQGHLAGTWPRARPRSPARKGSRPVSSHISLDPSRRLADAFAIYGVPRGITQYMSRKWSQPSAQGSVVHLTSSMRGRSALMSHQQLQEKVAAVRKASRVILLEAMQLRAHLPPAVSAQEHAALAPHLDALITLLHSHSIQVQEELGMLPGFDPSQFTPGSSFGEAPNYSSASPAAPSYNLGQPPSRARGASPHQGHTSSPSGYEEDSCFIAADDGPAYEEAAAEAAGGYGDSSADEEVQQITAASGTAYQSTAAATTAEIASKDNACLSEEQSTPHAQSPLSHSAGALTQASQAVTKAPEAMTKPPEARTHMLADVIQSAPCGGGILDEYRMRMHFSKETPMPGPLPAPTPPLGAPASVSMQRRWSKTNSYPDGSKGSQKAWESGVGGSFKRSAPKAPVDVTTYDDSSSGQVAPVSAESAEAAFKEACGDSFQRREDVFHPASHVAKSDEASSPELQLSRSGSQQHPPHVSGEGEESGKGPPPQLSTAEPVVSQAAASPRQLSASGSVLSQIAESTQHQSEVDLAQSVQSEEASVPKQATAAEQASDSAEDDYTEQFELDEPVAEATAVASLPQMMYDNPMGTDESAVEEEQQYMSGSDTAPSDAHAPHVATQLAVSDNGVVKLQCGLEEEEDCFPEHNDASAAGHMTPAAASAHVTHVNPQVGMAADGAATVQWSLDVSRDEPEEGAEEEDSSLGKGRFTKMPSTPFPRRSIFSAFRNMADEDSDLNEPVAMATAAASLPQMMYDNPVGDVESAGEEEQQPVEGSGGASSDGLSHAPHVATQLAVSDSGVVKLQCGLEEEEEHDDASAADHMTPATVQWSLDVSRDEPEEDNEEEDRSQGKGRATRMPSTPFPRRSIFSASGNMADDVDIFEQGDDSASDSAAESDFGGSLHRVLSSDNKLDSMGEAGVQLTPSYRQSQGRSLQQAADNEQPFAASWRPQPPQEAAQEAEAVNLAPKAISQTPSRQSSRGKPANDDMVSGHSTAGTTVPAKQASLKSNTAAAAAVPATLSSRGSAPAQQVGLEKLASGNLSRQPSYVPTPASGNLSKQPSSVPAPASAISSRRSSFSARIERETSQLLGVGSRQGSNAGSLSMPGADQPPQAVSRTASLSTNPALSPELSSKSLALDSQASSRTVSKRPSFSRPAELSRQSSQISRQSSGGTTLAAAAAPSAAASWTPSRQPSVINSAAPASRQISQVSRQPSMVSTGAAVVASPGVSTAAPASQMAASQGVSRQASLTQPTALSSQIFRQPSTASTAAPGSQMAASRAASRQASLTQPIALSRQASQMSGQPSTAAAAAAAAAPFEVTPRKATQQPSFNRPASASRRQSGSNTLVHSSQAVSRVPSQQPSLVTRGQPVPGATQESPVLGQVVSQSPSVSRTHSVSSQPQRTNSLEAMHRQMSMPRKVTAVGAAAPAAAVRRLSQDSEGHSSLRATHSRQPSNASVEVDRMLKSILPHNSGIPEMKEEGKGSEQALDDMLTDDTSSLQDFENSYEHDGRCAAEKHAYLHSQHGMLLEDGVF